MDYDRLNKIAGAVQCIVISVGLVVGGIWTAYTFGALRNAEQAQAALEARTAPSLSVSLETKRVQGISPNMIGLIVVVGIENNGGRHISIDLTQKPMKVVNVRSGDDGHLRAQKHYEPTLYADMGDSTFTFVAQYSIQIGSKKVLSYFIEVENPGIYFIRFRAPTGKLGEEMSVKDEFTPAEMETKTGTHIRGDYWGASIFVELR